MDKASLCEELKSYKESLFQAWAHERRPKTKRATLVNTGFDQVSFYMKRSESVFLKVMNAIEELENLAAKSILASIEIGKDICKINSQDSSWVVAFNGWNKLLKP